jgi:hypothetical protein
MSTEAEAEKLAPRGRYGPISVLLRKSDIIRGVTKRTPHHNSQQWPLKPRGPFRKRYASFDS